MEKLREYWIAFYLLTTLSKVHLLHWIWSFKQNWNSTWRRAAWQAWRMKLVAVYCPATEEQLKPHGKKKTKLLWGKMSWTRCFLKTERNCGTSDLVEWSSCDMNNIPKWKKQPLRLHMFPNSHNGCFTMHFLSGTWVGKGGSSPPQPTSYTNAIILLSHRKRERKKKRRESD